MANLPARLLDVLRCPVTGSQLVQDGAVLTSSAPGPDGEPLTYGLVEGIPVLLRPEPHGGTASAS
ncbi:Trm112 family protein [Arthrobacter sp. NPDC092385]|uniref:Trm112 family protein n=1 Tax=Arthrobacter sp. NPDC092385 TaxID=3363943 RepID=UPI00382CDDD3